MNFNCRIRFFTLLLFLFYTLGTNLSFAQLVADQSDKEESVPWEVHSTVAQTFDAKFPREYKYKVFPFKISNNHIAFSVEIFSTLDGKKDSTEKSVVLKSQHTLGEELSYTQVKNILKNTARRYEIAAAGLEGTVLTNEDVKHNGFLGKHMYITYKENGEKYGLRLAVYMTNYAKVEQILIGPAQTMYSYRSDDFFKSIVLYDGIVRMSGSSGTGWVDYTSKNKIFTAVLPPQNGDYTPTLPIFKSSPRQDAMKFEIVDPVLDQKIFYNVTGYKLGKKINRTEAKELLINRHISKFVDNATPSNIKSEDTITGDVSKMRLKLVIPPLKRHPYIRALSFDVRYKGDIMVVQEIRSSPGPINVGLDKAIFSLFKFHPEQYEFKQEKKKAAE